VRRVEALSNRKYETDCWRAPLTAVASAEVRPGAASETASAAAGASSVAVVTSEDTQLELEDMR